MLSVLCQFLIHVGVLVLCVELCVPYLDLYVPCHCSLVVVLVLHCWHVYLLDTHRNVDPDGPFAPNVINTVVFMASFVMQITTFCFNYQVLPHSNMAVACVVLILFGQSRVCRS
jgi:hypothetical protein